MQTTISASIASIIAGLLLEVQSFTASLPLWKDTVEHRAISRAGWFIVFTVLIYLVLRRYMGSGYFATGMSGLIRHIALGITTLLVFIVFAVRVIGLDVLVKLPKSLLDFANLWYAIPVAIAIHFVVLFVLNKY